MILSLDLTPRSFRYVHRARPSPPPIGTITNLARPAPYRCANTHPMHGPQGAMANRTPLIAAEGPEDKTAPFEVADESTSVAT